MAKNKKPTNTQIATSGEEEKKPSPESPIPSNLSSSRIRQDLLLGKIQGIIVPFFEEDLPPKNTACWVDRKFNRWISKMILKNHLNHSVGTLTYLPCIKAHKLYHFFVIGMGSRSQINESQTIQNVLEGIKKTEHLVVGRIGLPLKDFLPNTENMDPFIHKISDKIKNSNLQLY